MGVYAKSLCIWSHLRLPVAIGISALIVATDRKQFLEQALISAINQDLDPDEFEIVLIKNYTDESFDRALLRIPRRVQLSILTSKHREYGRKVLDAAISCRGRILSLLDDDDVWDSGKLSAVKESFSSDPDLVYFHNGQDTIDSNGQRLKSGAIRPPRYGKFVTRIDANKSVGKLLRSRADFNDSSISILREVLLEKGKDFETVNTTMDSFLFYLALESGGHLLIDHKPLTHYRVAGPSLSLSGQLVFQEFMEDRCKYHAAQVESLRLIRRVIITNGDVLGGTVADMQLLNHRMLLSVLSENSTRRDVAALLKRWIENAFTHHLLYEPTIALYAFIYLLTGRLARLLLYALEKARHQ